MAASDAVFVDSSAWIALLNADDRFHQLAAELFTAFRAARRPLVCTDWVFAETGNGLARTARRLQFIETVERFRRSRHCRWIHIDEDAFQRALKLYSLKDKQWGLVDCAEGKRGQKGKRVRTIFPLSGARGCGRIAACLDL
jgi:predicted nucleic acid-binding protein